MNWFQVILAAGRSSRMGFPKALATVDHDVLIRSQVRAGLEAGAARVFVVTGYHERRVAEALSTFSGTVETIRNPDPAGDQTTSMKTALNSVGTTTPSLMQLVDHPVTDPDLVESIVPDASPVDGDGALVRVPTYQGRRGHPPYFSSPFLEHIERMKSHRGINRLYEREDVTVNEVPVDDSSVLADLDTPADLFRYRESSPRM